MSYPTGAISRGVLLALAAVLLAACQSKPAVRSAGGGKSAALRTMEQVARAAHKCWFASNDADFTAYSFANELNSFSGRPRFLLVPKRDFGGKPLLVVQASGPAGKVEVFGPLVGTQAGGRILADVDRWSSGDDSCGSRA